MTEPMKLKSLNLIEKPKLSQYLNIVDDDDRDHKKLNDIYNTPSGRELKIIESLVPVII